MKGFIAALGIFMTGTGWGLAQTAEPPTPSPQTPAVVSELPANLQNAITEGPSDGSSPFCGNGCQGPCAERRWTGSIDYLLWVFPKDSESTVAATDGSLARRALASVGDQRLDRRAWSGGRLTVGRWLFEPHNLQPNAGIRVSGVEAKIFFLGEQSISVVDDRSPVIVRPFFDLNNRVESGIVIAAPGFATGGIAGNAKMDMWGTEANYWHNIKRDGPYTICAMSIMAGARYLELNPTIEINSVTQYANNLALFPSFIPFAGNRITSHEVFAAENRFYGGQVGIGSTLYNDLFTFDTSVKLALGATTQELTIEGSQIRTLPNGATIASTGSLLALPSNIGNHRQTKFSQVPEITFGATCPVLSCLNLRTEFMALYWTNLLRARDQIDRVIDITQIPNYPLNAGVTPTGFAKPGVSFEQSDVWILGVNFSAEFRW